MGPAHTHTGVCGLWSIGNACVESTPPWLAVVRSVRLVFVGGRGSGTLRPSACEGGEGEDGGVDRETERLLVGEESSIDFPLTNLDQRAAERLRPATATGNIPLGPLCALLTSPRLVTCGGFG
jgi:hypothetical protein